MSLTDEQQQRRLAEARAARDRVRMRIAKLAQESRDTFIAEAERRAKAEK